MKKNFITVMGVFGLGVVLLSFARGKEPELKKYEVIRSVNGDIQIYDTLVPVDSKFTPEDYLAQLGFDADENIQIINLRRFEGTLPMPLPCPPSGIFTDSIIHLEFTGERPPMLIDSLFTVEFNVDSLMSGYENGDMKIETRMMIQQMDSMNEQIMEFERMVHVQISDSMIDPAMLRAIDSTHMVMETIIIRDGEEITNAGYHIPVPVGDPVYEHHTENGNTKSDVMIFDNEGGNFTLLIVTNDTNTGDTQKQETVLKAPGSSLKLYPNPSDKEVTLQLNFEEKAPTTISVSDVNGKIVMQLDLGDFSGPANQVVDVSKWKKGIYFVNVDRPGIRLVEKLVVE